MNDRDCYINKIKKLSKAVDIKRSCEMCDIVPSNFWSGRISREKANQLYNLLLAAIFHALCEEENEIKD